MKDMNIGDLKGTYIDFEEPDSRSKVVYLESNNSKEYFTVQVFVAKNKYSDENKEGFDQVISTFSRYK
jgi:hypothetical protein